MPTGPKEAGAMSGTAQFDFDRWCSWAVVKSTSLSGDGLTLSFALGHPSPKRGATLTARTSATLAVMAIWMTGEADIDVLDLRTGEIVSRQWALAVDDNTFEPILRALIEQVKARGRTPS
jgi:hypothetical protein